MTDNYKTIQHHLHKYSFEFLKVSREPLHMLEILNENNPQMIQDAQKPNLLAAAIIYIYLKRNKLNGRGGITAKSVGEYFDVKGAAITQKAFDVGFWIKKKVKHKQTKALYEFIDKDRFEVNELYWEFLESPDANNVKKGIKVLNAIIKKDSDFFDPYMTLYEYYLMDRDFKNAVKIMERGFNRAIELIGNNEKFPDELPWGFVENRHIIRMLFNYAIFVWANGEKDTALDILMKLLRSNHNDNIGARYSIVAILEGFNSQQEYEEQFETPEGMLQYAALEEWFNKSAQKHKDVIGRWLD